MLLIKSSISTTKNNLKTVYYSLRNYIIQNVKWLRIIANIEVDVVGGLGSQLISIGAAKQLEHMGYSVYLNVDYFEKDFDLCERVTKFEMHPLICRYMNHIKSDRSKWKVTLRLTDSPLKFAFGIKYIIRTADELTNDLLEYEGANEINEDEFNVVIHVRRGDFKAVADYVTPVKGQLSRLSDGLLYKSKLIFVTDDPVEVASELECLKKIRSLPDDYIILGPDQANVTTAMCIMLKADILIASNSQLSLIASILNRNISFMALDNYVTDLKYRNKMLKFVGAVSSWRD